ncbi:MAG: Maf family protein [Microthrixaceae bacterium]
MARPLVLASASPYRAALLASVGLIATVDPPDVDERALDERFPELGAERFALELARRKAADVAPRHRDSDVLAGDQVGVVDLADGRQLQLHKQPDEDAAVEQLLMMSGTTHRLVNGLVLVHLASGRAVEGVDEQHVTMRAFDEREARAYVRRFEPYDSSGSYRIEDQLEMDDGEGFVVDVQGEDPSGVQGLPLPLVRRMIAALAAGDDVSP